MKNVKVVACDMDHTLLTEEGVLPPKFYETVDKLNELNIHFGIASGRPLVTLHTMFPEYKDKMFFISDNGGLVYLDGEVANVSLMKKEMYQEIINCTEKYTDGVCVLCGIDCAYLYKKHQKYEDLISVYFKKIVYVDDLSQADVIANKISVYCPNKDAKKYMEEVYAPRYKEDLSITLGDVIWIDFMNKGVNKGSAMKFIADKLEISTDQMMAFGDTYNDVEMLETVKFSYVVENASIDMRKHANYVAKSNDEYGVIQVLDELIECVENNK